MTELSANQKAFIRRMTEDEEYERRGFELLIKRPDFDIFFGALADAGLFDPVRNLGPIPADQPGYYRLPYWNALAYLEAAAKRSGENSDLALANKVMNVVREVSRWTDESGKIRDNENTWHTFATIFGLVPLNAITIQDIDLIPVWLEKGGGRSRVGAAFAQGPLRRFVASENAEDWSKACRILYHCTALRPATKTDAEARERPTTVVDDFWLKELINATAALLGAKAGKEAADVFLTRLRELFDRDMQGKMTYIARPAIEDDPQNLSYHGPQNRLVEGLRNVLLAWVDNDVVHARPFIRVLLVGDSEIARRIAIYLVNERFEALSDLAPLLFKAEAFNDGHLHELYSLLKTRFKGLSLPQKSDVLAAIRAIPEPESGDDRARRLRYIQRKWLSAIAGQGYQDADDWFRELMSDATLGRLSSHPDFHMHVESRWGFGPTPYGAQELVAFAERDNILETLNAFTPTNSWDGPTTRSLSDSLVEAVGLAPSTFLAALPSFIFAKREFQYSIIAGFKKLWDAWNGQPTEFDWNEAWPKLIQFFEEILNDQRFWSEKVTDDASLSPNRDWIPPVISEFLRAGTRNDDKAYKPDLLPRAWALINVLLEKSEAQQEPHEGDALNQAVNSSKGKAIEALFEYALRRCRLADASTGGHVEPWSEMRATFDKELAACRKRNFEFSALAGAYLANFQYLDMSWCHENIKRIFPLDFPANCLSALDGLAYAPATETIYREIADTGILRWALQHGMKEYARERLVQRMCLAYIWGTEELQSPNFAFLFDNKMTDDLEKACRYLWSIRGQPILDEQKNRILAFWSKCINWARQVKPVPDKLLSALSLLSGYLKSIGQRELECLLAVAPHVSIDYNADLLIQELERLGPASPLEVAQVLLTLLQTYRPAYDFEDRLKTLVMQLGARSETRQYALQCADRLRNIPGMIQLYAQISEQPVG